MRNNCFDNAATRSTAVSNRRYVIRSALTADAAAISMPRNFEQARQQDAQNDRSPPGIFHPRRPCRRAARSDHRRAGDADLSDHVLRVQRRRSRRLAVRAAGVRQHLYPHRQPDQRGAGRARRRARRRHRGAGGRVRPRRAGRGVPAIADARRRVHRRAKTLWRLDQPVHPRLQELRLERGVGRSGRYRQLRARGHAAHQGDLHRVDRQSRRQHHRYRGDRRQSPARPACR